MPAGVGDWDKAGREEFGEENLCDSLEEGVGGKGGLSRWSAAELGVRLGIGCGEAEGEVKV